MYRTSRELNLLNRFSKLLQPEKSIGLELCKISVLDALWGSQIDRKKWSMRYLQEGRLRVLVGLSSGNLHGDFLLFYPDGKIWMSGVYRDNSLVTASMKLFMPDGSLARPAPLPDNVIPFDPKNRKLP
jgi:hypothetical protein